MLNQDVNVLLDSLESELRKESITPTNVVTPETLIVFTELKPEGKVLHIRPFESLPVPFQAMFSSKKKGHTVGQYKIVSIYDVWV